MNVTDLHGLWRRTVYQHDGQEADRTTRVLWLQGPDFFVDLRQPADLPTLSDVTCLRDLSDEHLVLLARQEGFAGTLTVETGIAEWHRQIDFHPDTGTADRAKVQLLGTVLTEIGTEDRYVEQWQRDEPVSGPIWGARLIEPATGRAGFVARIGDRLAIARERGGELAAGTTLLDALAAAPDLAARQDLLDCELSIGRIDAHGQWHVEWSSLPFKAGRVWQVTLGTDTLQVEDLDPLGALDTRAWQILEARAGQAASVATESVSAAFTSIPVIDVADLLARGAEACPETIAQMAHAARHVGFFSIIGHGCPPALQQRLLARAKEFFAQPMDRKMAVYIGNSSNHRGYVPEGEEGLGNGPPDKKEAYDLSLDLPADDPDAQRFPLLGPNQWPDLPGFAPDVMAYYDAAFATGRRLMQAFALILGKPVDFFDPHITKPPSQLRMIHYGYNPDAKDSSGIGAHTDYECLTLLLATVPGLEVMNGAGQWIDAPPVPGGLIINIGDMLEIMSDGAFIATSHRVRKVSAERYSFPLFFSLDYPTKVAPILSTGSGRPTLIAGEHLYAQTMQTFRYLRERMARGEVALPDGALKPSSFGQEARHEAPAA